MTNLTPGDWFYEAECLLCGCANKCWIPADKPDEVVGYQFRKCVNCGASILLRYCGWQRKQEQ